MSKRSAAAMAALGLSLGSQPAAVAQGPSAAPSAATQEARMSSRAIGTFDVKITPIAPEGTGPDAAFGRLALAKQFHGDLEGSSTGEMMTAGTAVEGSAGYVAIERVQGAVKGRAGTFVLLHQGTMRKGGEFNLTIVVVPDSGTAQLAGLTGGMAIKIAPDRTHSYEFEYSLPSAP